MRLFIISFPLLILLSPPARASTDRSAQTPCGTRTKAWRPPSAGELERRCNTGWGDACDRLGALYRMGIGGVRKDRERALRLFAKACTLRSGRGCASHAAMLSNPRDRNNWFPKRSVGLSRKACDYGVARSCTRVGWYYRNGRFVAQDAARARDWFEKGCSLGHGPACFGLALLLANGAPGVKKKASRAIELFHRACAGTGEEASGDACTVLGSIFGNKLKMPPVSHEQLLGTLRRQCEAKSERGCAGLAVLRLIGGAGVKKDVKKALALARRACDAYQPGGCFYLSLFHAGGIGVPKSPSKAVRALLRGCRMGNLGFDGWWGSGRSCMRLGVHHFAGAGVKRNYHAAGAAFRRACRHGDADGCGQIGILMARGRGGYAFDPPAGLRRLQVACSYGSGSSCFATAKALRTGVRGISKDPKRAEEYRRRACRIGYRLACKPF